MSNYLKGLLTNEEVIQELLKIAHEIAHGKESDKALDLNDAELAFYDALTIPEAVRDFYTNEQLGAITRELTDALRLEPQGERPCRYAPDRDTTAQEV
mgnify:CR=1 FL=1